MTSRFLWVQLQLQSLCSVSVAKREDEVKKALECLPDGLDATYVRIINRINGSKPYMKRLAILCFQLVFFAQRPLKLEELQHAIAQKLGHNDSDVELQALTSHASRIRAVDCQLSERYL